MAGAPRVEIAGGELEGCRVGRTIGFTNGELESLWIHLLTEGRDGAPCCYDRDDPRLLDLQERWLRRDVGVASGEYPWGLVWNRFNINGGFYDISIVFTAAGRRR